MESNYRMDYQEYNAQVMEVINKNSKARADYNKKVIKELQEKKKRASAPAQEQAKEEEEEVKPKKKRASKKSKDSDSDSDYEEKPKKKRASTKKAKAADDSDPDGEEEVKKPKKTAAAPKGAAKPKEPTPAKVKKPTIKDTIVEIVSRKRKGITCKEMLKELRKRGFNTSDVYVRNTCRDLGIVLEHEADRRALFMLPPGTY